MNNDINNTLQALVPILQMNGEDVKSIEAVQDWYTIDGIEYMKEVAEITYASGYRKYADIGCDANLTAVYDVMAVLQEIKPSSKCIGRIVRGVYEMPPIQPVASCSEIPYSSDTISRQQAIDALRAMQTYKLFAGDDMLLIDQAEAQTELMMLPPVQPESKELSEWKADFKGYINALILPKDDYDGIMEYIDEVSHAQPKRNKGKWIYNSPVTMKCDQCGLVIKDWDWHRFKNCPNCLADMRGEKE